MNEKIAAYDVKMTKTINNLDGELATIRAGRANPHVLDKVKVDYYGVATPVAQVGNVSVPEARLIVIQPWDASVLKVFEIDILASDIGINANNDCNVIRLAFPLLTEERRKELVKQVKALAEEAKVAIRNIRRDANEKIEKEDLAEDEEKALKNDIQDLVNEYNKDIERLLKEKEQELMTI